MDHSLFVNDPGICKRGNSFYYNKNNQRVTENLAHLHLKVPPAWKNVWYASNKNCHIHVYGTDESGKKQYILSEEWIQSSNAKKYYRMKQFIQDLQSFKRKIKLHQNEDIHFHTLLSLLFHLLIDLHIRVGNEIYAETNKTYGLTTLLQKHLTFENGMYTISFTGKSKIKHSIKIPIEYNYYFNKLKLSNKNNPLFWYRLHGKMQTINSEELNTFLRKHMGDYTCKDFRTYSANMLFIKAFLKNGLTDPKKRILRSIEHSAECLGHSKTICKKSYISNTLLNYCMDNFEHSIKLSSNELLKKI